MWRGFVDLQKCDHSTDKDNDTRLQMLALLHNVITVQTRTMTQDYRCWLCFTMWSQYRQGQWHKTTDVGSASQCDHSTDKDNDTRLQMLALLHNVITVQTRTMTQDYRCWLCFTMWSQYRQGQWHKTTDVGSASQCDHSTDKDNDTRLQMLALLHNVITVQTRTMTQDYRC